MRFFFLLSILIFSLFHSCAYKFSLVSRQNAGRYKSLYVARSLNPIGSVLPCDVFEDEIQKSMIQNFPDIRLESSTNADLYMRIVYQKLDSTIPSDVLPLTGEISSINEYHTQRGEVKNPLALEDIKQGRNKRLKDILTLVVLIEVWDLYSREMIFSKSYSASENYNVFFHPKLRLLEMDSRQSSILINLSKIIAQKTVGDLVNVL